MSELNTGPLCPLSRQRKQASGTWTPFMHCNSKCHMWGYCPVSCRVSLHGALHGQESNTRMSVKGE